MIRIEGRVRRDCRRALLDNVVLYWHLAGCTYFPRGGLHMVSCGDGCSEGDWVVAVYASHLSK